jgi:hypothetical protein
MYPEDQKDFGSNYKRSLIQAPFMMLMVFNYLGGAEVVFSYN